MTKRCCAVATAILCTGVAASVGAYFAANKFSYVLENHYFEQKAAQRVEVLKRELEERLAKMEELGAQLADLDVSSVEKLPESQKKFEELAKPLQSDPSIAAVEWAPLVHWQDRPDFIQRARTFHGREQLQIRAFAGPGQRVTAVAKKNKQSHFPVLFGLPRNRLNQATLLHRGRIQPQRRIPVLATNRRFYPAPKSPRHGAYYLVRRSGSEDVTGMLSVIFRASPFGVSVPKGDPQPVRVRINDVATPPRSPTVGTEFTINAATAAADDGLTSLHENIGGCNIRFDCQRNPNYDFRPAWLPWTAFVSGLAITALCACGWTMRDNRRLERRVTTLSREVDERKQMQRFLQTVLEFREQERELVAHEIHDGFVQEVVGAQMFVQAIGARISEHDHSSQRDLAMAGQLLSKAIEEGRRMISDLKPSVVDELGLLGAIKQLVSDEEEHFGLSIMFRHSANFRPLPSLVERTLYRIIQESVTNVKRHSGAFEATVSVIQTDRSVVLEVKDLGRGFDISQVDDGRFGVRGIQERARLLHGHATISSAPQKGACVTVEIPVDGLAISSTPHSQHRLTAAPKTPTADESSRAASP